MELDPLKESLDLPAFVAHLLNQVADAGTRDWLLSADSLGHRFVWEVAVCTGFFNADDPEGVETIGLINRRAEEVYACLAQAEAGKVLTRDDLRFLEQ